VDEGALRWGRSGIMGVISSVCLSRGDGGGISSLSRLCNRGGVEVKGSSREWREGELEGGE
jgi:hypothetical protein